MTTDNQLTFEVRRKLEPQEIDDHLELLAAASRESDFVLGYIVSGLQGVDNPDWELVTIHNLNPASASLTNARLIRCYAHVSNLGES